MSRTGSVDDGERLPTGAEEAVGELLDEVRQLRALRLRLPVDDDPVELRRRGGRPVGLHRVLLDDGQRSRGRVERKLFSGDDRAHARPGRRIGHVGDDLDRRGERVVDGERREQGRDIARTDEVGAVRAGQSRERRRGGGDDDDVALL